MTESLDCAAVGSVLLVDDNESDNFLHRMVLERHGFAEKIIEARNGEEARFMLASEPPVADGLPPDVIFLDIRMPVLDGFGFLESYRRLPPERRARRVVVMLTSSLDDRDRERARQSGVVDLYVQKPLTAEHLADLRTRL